MSIKITKFHKYENGNLYGFIDISVPIWGTNMNIKGCKIFIKEGKPSIMLPSQEYQNDNGETKYRNLIGFDSEDVYRKFLNGILESWNLYCQNKNQETEGVPF